jgi:serine/threonine protein kinase
MSVGRLDDGHELGLFEYARHLQYGLGLDSNPEEAADFYELVPRTERSTSLRHSFRCLRGLNRANLTTLRSRRSTGANIPNQEYCRTSRNLTVSQMISDYAANPIGLCGGRAIGRGGSSQVKLVLDRTTGKSIAVKYISGPNLDKVSFVREIESLSTLNHPCVLRIIRWAFPKGSGCWEIHTEYAEHGSLEDVLEHKQIKIETGLWTATRIGIVICDIVLGMRFVHLQQIIHRDLKPSNILIRSNGRALVGGFGSSHFKSDDATLTTQSGTVHYAAPELFEESGELTPKVDVWGFGLILFEIVCGHPVFPISLSPFDVIRQMRRRYRPTIGRECGEYMRGLIRRCWSDDPCSRPSFDQILRDFQAHRFAILPDADCDAIRVAVEGVLKWESDAGVSQSWRR